MTDDTPRAGAASDNPASRNLPEGVEIGLDTPTEVVVGSGNVFADLGVLNPGTALRLADARIAGLPEAVASALAELVNVAIESVGEQDPQLVAALDATIAAIMGAVLPAEMTAEMREVLGLPNFRTGPIAHVYRAAGHSIRPKMEDEQAFVLFRFLRLALQHGPGWFAESCIDLTAARDAAIAKLPPKAEPAGEPTGAAS